MSFDVEKALLGELGAQTAVMALRDTSVGVLLKENQTYQVVSCGSREGPATLPVWVEGGTLMHGPNWSVAILGVPNTNRENAGYLRLWGLQQDSEQNNLIPINEIDELYDSRRPGPCAHAERSKPSTR